MCIDAPEWTTNSRSSGVFEVYDGAIIISLFSLTPIEEIKRSFVRIFELVNIFAKSPATLRAHLSWCKVSSCDLSPNFGAKGLRS